MSQPTFPENPAITRDDAINQILSSIAMEELGLSHVINAEGEKLQYTLGTIPGVTSPTGVTIRDLLSVNDSVRSTLETATNNQIFLNAKMSQALASSNMQGPAGPMGPPGQMDPAIVTLINDHTTLLEGLQASGNYYITETATGFYFNGKPIYRQVFEMNITANVAAEAVVVLINQPNYVDVIVSTGGSWATGRGFEKSSIDGAGVILIDQNGLLIFESISYFNARTNAPATVWVEYTKV